MTAPQELGDPVLCPLLRQRPHARSIGGANALVNTRFLE
jgi:hypothetical protein